MTQPQAWITLRFWIIGIIGAFLALGTLTVR